MQELCLSVALWWVVATFQLATPVITCVKFTRFHFVGPQAVTAKEYKGKDKRTIVLCYWCLYGAAEVRDYAVVVKECWDA